MGISSFFFFVRQILCAFRCNQERNVFSFSKYFSISAEFEGCIAWDCPIYSQTNTEKSFPEFSWDLEPYFGANCSEISIIPSDNLIIPPPEPETGWGRNYQPGWYFLGCLPCKALHGDPIQINTLFLHQINMYMWSLRWKNHFDQKVADLAFFQENNWKRFSLFPLETFCPSLRLAGFLGAEYRTSGHFQNLVECGHFN